MNCLKNTLHNNHIITNNYIGLLIEKRFSKIYKKFFSLFIYDMLYSNILNRFI